MFRVLLLMFFCVGAIYGNQINPVTPDLPRIAKTTQSVNELSQLNDLIAATKRSMEQLTLLQEIIKQYQETQTVYLKDSDNVELLYRMIKLAHHAQDLIQEMHLSYAFDTEFLNELNLFAQMANKRGIPKS